MARRTIDWDAIERDYRTGKFSFGELSTKYGIDKATIVRAKKRGDWQQDLSEAVRHATNAMLMQEMVTAEITEGHRQVTDTILAAAEVNKQVILGQRNALAKLERDLSKAQDRLVEVSQNAVDVREVAVVVQAIESVGRTMQRLHDGQRKAYGLDEVEERSAVEDLLEKIGRS